MNPVIGSTKVDKILTQFSIAYRNAQYISPIILPFLKVKEKNGKFAKYSKDNLRVHSDSTRAPGTRAKSADYTVSQGSYACAEHALEKLIPDEFMNNQDSPYDAKRDGVMFLKDKIWGGQEAALATSLADTAIITQNTTRSGTDQWSDYAESDPLSNLRTARSTIKGATGQTPNLAFFGFQTWEQLRFHPDVVDRVKYVGTVDPGAVLRAVAQLLDVERVVVGDAVQNTANEGQADSLSYIWGKHAWLAYVAPRPSLVLPAFGYTFKDVDSVVDSYREEEKVSDVVRVRESYDQAIIDDTLAYLIKDAVA